MDRVVAVVTRQTEQAFLAHNLFAIVGCTLEGTDFTNMVRFHAKRAVTSKLRNDPSVFDLDALLRVHRDHIQELLEEQLTTTHVPEALTKFTDMIDRRIQPYMRTIDSMYGKLDKLESSLEVYHGQLEPTLTSVAELKRVLEFGQVSQGCVQRLHLEYDDVYNAVCELS